MKQERGTGNEEFGIRVVSSGRMERIPEAEFDASPHCLADGWRVVARKGGYVYIGDGGGKK
jgi:hypothetical protein